MFKNAFSLRSISFLVASAEIAGPVCALAQEPIASTNHVAIFNIAAATVTLPDGEIFTAHSGLGAGLDNSDMQNIPNIGPIPVGIWSADAVKSHKFYVGYKYLGTRLAIALKPLTYAQALGRTKILMHQQYLNGQSHGCIVFSAEDINRILVARNKGVFDEVMVEASDTGRPTFSEQTTVREASALTN